MKRILQTALITIFITIFFISSVFAINIEVGDKGTEVKNVQKLFAKLGYDLSVDGVYGFRTKEVVKDFQFSNGLTVDGIVGNETFKKLKNTAEDIKYTVKAGDTLSEIADNLNSTVKTIEKRNKLKSDKIYIGQVLLIPKTGIGGGEEDRLYSNIYYDVQPGDALSVLAKKYGSDIQTIKLANKMKNNRIYIGQTLMIPHIRRGENQPFHLAKGSIIWPVLGRISSSYGYRTHPIRGGREFHSGLDIAVPIGTKIRAAASGKVIQAGWISGYGYTIIIDHGDGIRTLYGHNSRLLVRAGSTVGLGEVIALSGSTGLSTGGHLHFGIYKNGKTVNPKRYLP